MVTFTMTIFAFSLLMPMRPAQAACCCASYAACEACAAFNESFVIPTAHDLTTQIIEQFLDIQFDLHELWIEAVLWNGILLPALRSMADQLTAVSTQQTLIIGTFFDAKHQLETQRVLQTIRARAHKDYHPSSGVCEFGTSIRSLAASERRAELNAHVMSQRSQDRMLGNANVAASDGAEGDLGERGANASGRIGQYAEKFCDPRDSDSGLDVLCDYDGLVPTPPGAVNPERANKDIDYARTVEYPWTLNVNFTDNNLTEEEEEILALSSNLYSQRVFRRLTATLLNEDSGGDDLNYTPARANYLDARALVAKLSVAENSFNAITSMKSAGTAGSRAFLENIIEELGVNPANGPPSDTLRLLGMDDANNPIGPSYYAQMEVLTKKIYQNPDFYTNLYDKPVNVERKKVAMQAIGLMQKFDLFKSYLRAESNLSVLLELAVEDLQIHVENELSKQSP